MVGKWLISNEGGGIYDIKKTLKPMSGVLNKYLNITESNVTEVLPEENSLITADGSKFTYD